MRGIEDGDAARFVRAIADYRVDQVLAVGFDERLDSAWSVLVSGWAVDRSILLSERRIAVPPKKSLKKRGCRVLRCARSIFCCDALAIARSVIAAAAVDLTEHRLARAMTAQVVEHDIDGGVGPRRARDVRRDAHARMRPQRMRGGQRLGIGDIENRVSQLAACERREQIVLIQLRAAPDVASSDAPSRQRREELRVRAGRASHR